MVLARTVANGCDRERNVERTHPQPPDPQSETGTLATHSGKNEETLPRGEPQQSGIGQYGDNMGGLSEKKLFQKRLTMPKLEQDAKQSVCLTPKFERKK